MSEQEGWNTLSKHILSELSQQTDSIHKLRNMVHTLQLKIEGLNLPRLTEQQDDLIIKTDHLEKDLVVLKDKVMGDGGILENLRDRETRLRLLENSQNTLTGKSTVIGAISAVVLAALVSFLFNLAEPKAGAHKEKPAATSVVRPADK